MMRENEFQDFQYWFHLYIKIKKKLALWKIKRILKIWKWKFVNQINEVNHMNVKNKIESVKQIEYKSFIESELNSIEGIDQE